MNIGQISVYYNSTQISPTPLVNQNETPLILNGIVWGHINEISLHGYLTGLSGQGGQDYLTVANIFSGNFGQLSVYDITSGSNLIYQWNTVAIDNISLDNSDYPRGGFLKYTIQLKSYADITSGVINPSNEYSFKQNEDNSVDLQHKISAQGIRTNIDPLDNAINFVNLFEGNSLSSVFIPYGNPVLLSETEMINRVESIYTVTQIYRFITGSTNNYTQVSILNIDQSEDKDYVTLDYNSKYQSSPITGNVNTLASYINSNNYLNEISNTYGISIINIYQSTFSVVQDSGAGTIEVKTSYISGLNNDITGYFDYVINLEKDLVMQKNIWKVDGDFITHGTLSFKQQLLNNFINLNSPFQSYLENIINTSPLSSQYGNLNVLQTNQLLDFTIQQNTGMALFKTTIDTRDLDPSYNLINPKFNVNFEPGLWNFELIPACNIEGEYVVQDLQMVTQSKMDIGVACSSSGNSSNFSNLSTLFNNLSGTYIPSNTGFNIKYIVESGILDKSIDSEWLFSDIIGGSTFSNYKIIGSISSNFIRSAGFLFGL